MISRDSVQTLIGGTAYTTDGDKIGNIGQVYLDNASGEPAWVTVKTGFFGTSESFVPLDQAELTDDGVRVPYDKDRVKGAPNIETDRELSEQEEDQLYSYYGLATSGHATSTEDQTSMPSSWGNATGTGERADITDGEPVGYAGYDAGTTPGSNPTLRDSDYVGDTTDTGTTAGTYETQARTSDTGYDTSGPTTDDAMTRSEERLRAGTESREAGRARLRKYVVTEQQQVNVPVSREEVRVEREPITDGNVGQAMDGPALSEEEHEVVLNEERPVVSTEAVPVERVRLSKEQVQDEETVTADVRKEQIDMEGDNAGRFGDDDRNLGR
jgi:uncharacterized protein (TIGR02271 family)